MRIGMICVSSADLHRHDLRFKSIYNSASVKATGPGLLEMTARIPM
jgi:hypothetical protein